MYRNLRNVGPPPPEDFDSKKSDFLWTKNHKSMMRTLSSNAQKSLMSDFIDRTPILRQIIATEIGGR